MAQVCPAWAAIIDETWMWTDDEVRLRLSAYTTYFSPLHQRGISMVRVEELQLPFGTLPRLLQALPDIKSLNLSYCVRLSNDVIRRAFSASMWTSLAVLNLSCCPYVSDIGMECVTSTLPNLEQLHINGCYRIRSLSMALIASRLRKLKLIEMNKCRIGNKGLRLLSGLSVPEERVDEEAMPKLEHISIRSSTFVTHSGLLFIGQRMQHLKTLDIAMCSSVQDRAISEIARIATLKHLDLHGCNKLTARSIEYLSTGPLSLAYLDISYCPQIGDDALEKVFEGPGLWSLTTLHMASTSITDYGLTIVALTLERLTTLDVSSCEAISERGIETVSTHIGNLRYLYLRFCRRLHNDSFMNPTCMANLKVVSLKGCRRIGSPGMEALASGGAFANLLELDVGFTSVDDIGLKYIAQVILSIINRV
ncbi:hypothetical protein HPB48_025705 [Haemaphysalis longicornis]|uniref:F-box/LRR-repeat protein 15-like leucin rich repeat domain-containing protein n=1 Tax=Haemaphysalis longicornis TaxID=44386 RepID=A0A9J6H9Z5_HAELO|nr:hypothetical protein HPB48_025705 [Haemaphysalis longicornis]